MKPTFTAFLFLFIALLQSIEVASFVAPARHNATLKHKILFAPLHVDVALGLAKDADAPRGVVLNSGVGGLVAAGGLMGFIKAGSKASLIAGSTFGGLMLGASYLIAKGKTTGNKLGAFVASLLTYTMGKKFLKSGKFMPAGLIATMAVVAVVYNSIEAFSSKGTSGEGASD